MGVFFTTILAAGLLTGCGGSGSASGQGYNMTEEEVSVYYEGKYGSDQENVTMYFLDGNKQIAYYDMDTVQSILNKLYQDGYGDYEKDPAYAVSYSSDGADQVTFTRENGYDMVLNFAEDSIHFTDYDMFISHSYDMSPVDLSHSSGYDADGQPVYLQRVESRSFSRYGKELTYDLAAYDIDLIHQGDAYYLPAQTLYDVLLGSTYTLYLYNGEDAFYINYENFQNGMGEDDSLVQKYYDTEQSERSQALIDYTYHELCMVLDYSYGLKDSHNIDSFDEYFQEMAYDGQSLKDMLRSEDPLKMDQALQVLTYKGFADMHSGFMAPSAFTGLENLSKVRAAGYAQSIYDYVAMDSGFRKAREKALGLEQEEVNNYQEVGDTAFITFDHFLAQKQDYYKEAPTDETQDTVGLLIYAHSQITREDSPIKNVVLDISCNGGGEEDAVAFVCAWFLGDASIYLQNPMTGASAVNVYRCDVNLDHTFDEKDTLSGFNLYCLTSPASFSCGNLAPCMFACSDKVTLIGQTTGGGSCVVLPMTTASGSFFQVSGFRRISSSKNGSFYNSDQGVTPDILLTKTESFYDRESLVEMIDKIK